MNAKHEAGPATRVLSHLTPVLAALAALLSVTVIVAWVTNSLRIASISAKFIPMAPSTALCFVLLSAVLLCRQWPAGDRSVRRVWRALAGIVLLAGLAIVLQSALVSARTVALDIEQWVVPASLSEQGYVVGRMSPLTALLFALLSSATLLSLPIRDVDRGRDRLAQSAATVVLVVASTLVVGYWYGAPLLYGGPITPVAVTTAIAFILLSGGFLFEGTNALLTRWVMGTSVFDRFTRLVVPGTMGIILVVGWAHATVLARQPPADQAVSFSLSALVTAGLVAFLEIVVARQLQATVTRGERALRDSSYYARSLIEASLDPLVTISAQGKITDVNEASVQATGVPRAQLVGTDFADCFTEPQKAREGYRRALSEGSVHDYALGIRHVSGRVTDVLYNASLYRDEQGQVLGVFAAARDMSERKRAEEALKRSEALLTATGRMAKVGGWELDPATLDVHWTEETYRIHELPLDRKPPLRQAINFFHPDDRETLSSAIQRALERAEPYDMELRFITAKGTPLWTRTICKPRVVAGKVVKLEGTLQDITERKRAEEALRESENKFRLLAEFTYDWVYWLDSEFRFVYSSPSCQQITGYSAEEFINNPSLYLRIVHPDDRTPFVEHRKTYQSALEHGESEFRIVRRDGSLRWIEHVCKPILAEDGRCLGRRSSNRDITERKRLDEALLTLNADLARSNKELEQFAYVASHDLQEPLRMVGNYVRLLERRYKGQLDADADEFIGYAAEGAARMQQLINDLLLYSRAGRRGRPFEAVDCAAALGQARLNLQSAIEEASAIVTHDDLPSVLGDEAQLVQLFQNLIGNGIKFRGARPALVHVSARREPGQWVFSVRDNGIGIAPEYLERIFVIFQRLHPRERYPGTGIGLSICQRVVEGHGGRIWVESTPGEGSTFFFSLPAGKDGRS
jgi:PAS domain S-box-containing protein